MSIEIEIGPHLAHELSGLVLVGMLLVLALSVRLLFSGFGSRPLFGRRREER